MADLMSILSSSYVAAGSAVSRPGSKYVAVDPAAFEGSWKGKYANNQAFEFQVSNVVGFRAKVKYQSGATTKYQEVLIKDNAFRVGDSKFILTRDGVAQIKTVVSDALGSTLETAFAQQTT